MHIICFSLSRFVLRLSSVMAFDEQEPRHHFISSIRSMKVKADEFCMVCCWQMTLKFQVPSLQCKQQHHLKATDVSCKRQHDC